MRATIAAGNGTFTTQPATGNAGTGIIDPGSVTDTTAYTGDSYSIQFTSANVYKVVDTTSGTTVLSNQTYQSGSSISFDGIQTTITGVPASGDSFTVAPSGQQSVFQTVQNIVDTLNMSTASSSTSITALHNTLNQQLASLDQALSNVVNVQASVGSRQNAVTSQQSLQQNWGIQLQTAQSKIQDVDYAKAISQYQLQLTGLQAAQKTYTQVQGLSLFNYL